MTIEYAPYESPLGRLTLAFGPRGLCGLVFADYWDRFRDDLRRSLGSVSFRETDMPPEVRRRLDAYFAGDVHALDATVVDPSGTSFQRKVWAALRRIPAGKTVSYQELADMVGCRGGARAVGAANGANPVAIVIPCHRVIRADGSLCGYGGGVERKAWLLRHEGVQMKGRERQPCLF
jgi:O-6-methylguanine DNA methyltransferase